MDIEDTFCPTINQWLQRVLVVHVDHIHEGGIDPSPCFDAVETANNKLKLHIEILIELLYSAVMRCNLDALDSLLDKFGGDFCLELSDVVFAKEKLAVKVRYIDGV